MATAVRKKKTTGKKAKKPPTRKKASAPVSVTHDQIAKQAYLIWLEKGQPTGMDNTNWQEAEAVLAGA